MAQARPPLAYLGEINPPVPSQWDQMLPGYREAEEWKPDKGSYLRELARKTLIDRGVGEGQAADFAGLGGKGASTASADWAPLTGMAFALSDMVNPQTPGDTALAATGIIPGAKQGMQAAKRGVDLAMDEASRLARAVEQGYTIDAYKGMQAHDWRTMPSRNFKGEIINPGDPEWKVLTEFNSPDPRYAGFFSDSPDVASRFGSHYTEGGAVFPAKLKFENPTIIDGRGEHAAAFQFPSIARERGTEDLVRKYEAALADPKSDGVIIKNTKDEGTVYIPKQSHQARSRFAAFDPRRIGDADMLASLAGAAPLAALGVHGASRQEQAPPVY